MPSTLLEGRGVGKRFGGVQALADVSFSIRRGEIYGLIGPNGAGKTTLFNVLTGIYAPDAGEFIFDGALLAGLAPHQVAARGIARTFQNIRLFANLSVLENVMIGRHVRTRAGVQTTISPRPAHVPRRTSRSSSSRTAAAFSGDVNRSTPSTSRGRRRSRSLGVSAAASSASRLACAIITGHGNTV